MAEPVKELEKCVNNDFNPCYTENAEYILISKAAFGTRQNEKICIGRTFMKNTNIIELLFHIGPIIKDCHGFRHRKLYVKSIHKHQVWRIDKRTINDQGIIGEEERIVANVPGETFPSQCTFKFFKMIHSDIIVSAEDSALTTDNASAYDNVCFTEHAKFITLEATSYDKETCVGATLQEKSLNVQLKFYIVPTHANNVLQLIAKSFNTEKTISVWFNSDLTTPKTNHLTLDKKHNAKILASIPIIELGPAKIDIKISLHLNVQNKSVEEYSELHKKKMYNCIINNVNIETVHLESNDGGNFAIIKDILLANSDVFKAMFTCDMYEAKNRTLRIEELNTSQLKSFIKYMLTGDINYIEESDLVEMLNLAEKYNMDDLKQWIQSKLWRGVRHENCIEMYRTAIMFKLALLERRAEEMLGSAHFMKSESFKNLKDIDLVHKCVELKFKYDELKY